MRDSQVMSNPKEVRAPVYVASSTKYSKMKEKDLSV